MYDGPIISGEPCKTHAAHYQFNDVGCLVCVGCLVWRDERVWPDKVNALELQVEELQNEVRAANYARRSALDVQDNLQRLLSEAKETAAKIVEAHKGICKQFHDDCCAQVAAEIRGYIEKRNHESVRETAERLGMKIEPRVIQHCKVTDHCADSDLCKCTCCDCRPVVEF